MDLRVTITLSDKLFELLEDKLPNLGRRVQRAVNKELGAQVRKESNVTIDVSALGTSEAPKTEVIPEPEPQADPEPKTAPAVVLGAADEVITPERARAHLKETRRRLLGENYEDLKGTLPYKAITALAKQIILLVSKNGADTIPKLSDAERKRFIEECDSLIIGEDGMPSFPRAPF